ncbi:hypothetical protein C7N43_28385 [Sphingobacteriales bacterium UPWRP_1]|nr:hypothetical protein BVG80_18280 [Sphingobacteriales bacterium TSM_CSM]PSJ73591.1 hypothetical protein C7N43_28385 [Sphingobacteriales bacterium UPWRP_1]
MLYCNENTVHKATSAGILRYPYYRKITNPLPAAAGFHTVYCPPETKDSNPPARAKFICIFQ